MGPQRRRHVRDQRRHAARSPTREPGVYAPVLRVTDAFGGSVTRALAANVYAATLDPNARYHVLVFSKTAAFRHSAIPNALAAIRTLGQQNNFTVDATEDASLFTDAFLSRYDLVVFNSTTGDVLTDTQQAAFERFIRAGNGYTGIHSATDTEYGWPWYGRLTGAYFRNHPNGTPTATVVVEDAEQGLHAGPPGALVARRRVVQLPEASTTPWSTAAETMSVPRAQHADPRPADDGRVDVRRVRRHGRHRRRPPDRLVQALRRRPDVLHRARPHRGHLHGCELPQASARWHGHRGRRGGRRRLRRGPERRARADRLDATRSGTIGAGDAVEFTATATDADGNPLTYAWDFGDSSPRVDEQNPSHTYNTPGTYTAKVTVSDGKGGTDGESFTIVVEQRKVDRHPVGRRRRAARARADARRPGPFGALIPGVARRLHGLRGRRRHEHRGRRGADGHATRTPPTPGKLVNGTYALAAADPGQGHQQRPTRARRSRRSPARPAPLTLLSWPARRSARTR